MKSDFVHLHLHSQYSLLDGAIKFEELVDRVKELDMGAVAITDHGNLFGAYEFHRKAREKGVKPIIGCEIYVTPTLKLDKPSDGKNFHLTVLCMNETGYRNLSNLVTRGYFEGLYRRPRVDHEMLDEHNEGLIVLSGCMSSELSQAIFRQDKATPESVLSTYKEIFGDRYYLEVQATGIREQNRINKELKKLGEKFAVPLVATNDCHFLRRSDHGPHDVLLCIQTGKMLKDEGRMKFQGDGFYLKTREEMEKTLKGFGDALDRSVQIAERCDFEFKDEGYHFPKFDIGSGATPDEFLHKLAAEKLRERIFSREISPELHEEYKKRLSYELDEICKMGFADYFLVVADFVGYAKQNGIPVGPGRGSAAGSLAAYALGITDVDPILHKLIFERFLNPGRISMPDIDIDFCTEGRDKVIEYVSEKYGSENVVQIGTFGKMSSKAVVRDVGRVMGIPYGEVDKASKLIPSFRGKVFSIEKAVKKSPDLKKLVESSDKIAELIEMAKPLENMVRHSSTHAAGVIIASDRISNRIPLYKGSRGETVTQFDMGAVESLGYVKFDFLGLKTLTIINKAIQLISESGESAPNLDIDHMPLDDPEVYKLFVSGNTHGLFQIESSSGMVSMLRRLKTERFEDIVAALALYRPGPLDSGMVEDFIKRKHGKARISYPHPLLEDILKETHGLFVYQEQIMRTASVCSDYSLSDADLMRRAMGKKKTKEMKAQREKFVSGARKNGIDKTTATEMFDTMEKFAGYSFNKSHSTAYALLTYQTAYLKAHYPAEFMSSLMTVDSGNNDKVISHIAECRKMGIEVLPPDVNESMSGFTPVDSKTIRFGLSALKSIGDEVVSAIIEARREGVFNNIFEFCSRVRSKRLTKKVFEMTIKSGTFDSLESNRASLMESLDSIVSYASLNSLDDGRPSLFSSSESVMSLPDLVETEPWSEEKRAEYELESLGLFVSSHPMTRYAEQLKVFSSHTDTSEFQRLPDKKEVLIAGVVRSISIKTTKSGSGLFGRVVLEDLKGSVEGVVFNNTITKSRFLLEQKKEPVILAGAVDGASDKKQIRVKEVISVSEFSAKASQVTISINEKAASPTNLMKLENILKQHHGESKVNLSLGVGGKTVFIEVGKYGVETSPDFVKEVENLLGDRSLSLEFH